MQQAHDLVCTRGYGATYAAEGGLPSPGFVLRTDKAWEDLLGHALRAGLDELDVRRAPTYLLGHRGVEEVIAHPDYAIIAQPDVLLAAKNRSRLATHVAIGRDDLYESLAFLRAAGASRMILLYPLPGREPVQAVGTTQYADEITVAGLTVTALTVEVRGISDLNGWPDFSLRLGEGIRSRLPKP